MEYNTFGVVYPGIKEDIAQVTTRPVAGLPNGRKEYKLTDHLSSTRVTVDENAVVQTYDYDPYGNLLSSTTSTTHRQGYNGREVDIENGEFNLGVRKYSGEEGRFTSIDPLWEKFRGQSPYVYADNNPLTVTDPTGMQALPLQPNPLQRVIFAGTLLSQYAETADGETRRMANGEPQVLHIKGTGTVTIGGANLLRDGTTGGDDASLDAIKGQITNGPLDAFRHAIASALTARIAGAEATVAAGNTYETLTQDSRAAHQMDRWNNRIGADIGAANPKASDSEIRSLVMQAMLDGKLQLWPKPPTDYGRVKELDVDR